MLTKLSRWTVALVVALGLFLVFAAPAGATDLSVSGSYAGSAFLTLPECQVAGAGTIGHTVDATGLLKPLGDVEVDGIVCLAEVSPGLLGWFTFTTLDGWFTAKMTGTLSNQGDVFAEDMRLTVTEGAGRFDRVTGKLHVDGIFDLRGTSATGEVEGTLTLPDYGTTD